MKKVLFLGVFLLSNYLFAEQTHTVKLNLDLQIDKLCNSNIPFCLKAGLPFGNVEVILYPQNGEYNCDVRGGECELENITHFRGLWSKVVEMDGVRSIAIVSIDKRADFVSYPPAPQSELEYEYFYTIKAEILGEDGLEAKMRINTHNLNSLNTVTLEGPVKEFMESRYQASLSIGKPIILQPIPGKLPCRKTLSTECEEEKVSFRENDIELIMGTLR